MIMKRARTIVGFSSLLVATLLAAGSVLGADGDKTYVAFFGNDANNCFTPAGACRTLQRAIDQTNPGGSIVLDPPLFNADTAIINKPLTIHFNGNQSDSPILTNPPNPTANLIISAGGNDTITIDGLNMNLLGADRNGIQVNRGNLILRNSTIQNIEGNKSGIYHQPNFNSFVLLSNNTINNTPISVTFIGRNGADIAGTIDDTAFVKNGTGIRSIPGAGSNHDIVVRNSVFSGNTIGLQSSTNRSNIRIGNSTITGNTTGLSRPGGGLITSLTGNSLTANTANGSFSGTVNTQ
jgi:hypothetical protein